MCFVINVKHSEEKIAKKDIVCYKRLCVYIDIFISPYLHYFYRLNILYRSELKPSSDNTIDIGFHSYSCKKYATSRLIKDRYEVLAKGIIPKGSRYYYNPDDHEYVSNQIIIQEVINNK